MHLEWVGGRFVAAVLLLAVAGNAAFAQEHKTYRCKVADVVKLDDDGRLRSDSNPKDILRQRFDGVLVDTLTGAVTYGNGDREVWKVAQQGSSNNDYVLIRPTEPGLTSDKIADIAATDFIRIRAWSVKPTVRLLAFGLSDFASGPCEVALIRPRRCDGVMWRTARPKTTRWSKTRGHSVWTVFGVPPNATALSVRQQAT